MKISMALILHLLEIRIWTQVFDSKHPHNNGKKTCVQVNIGVWPICFVSQSKYNDFHFLHLFILCHLVAQPHISLSYAVVFWTSL